MRFFSFLLMAWLGCFSLVWAQKGGITSVEVPASERSLLVLPPLDNDQLLAEEMARRAPGVAPRFAHTFSVSITPATHGSWQPLDAQTEVWRYRIRSQGALSLNLGFSLFEMPYGGELYLKSTDSGEAFGPFTPADNESHQQLWTPLLQGDELIVEVRLPLGRRRELGLHLTHINHDFLGFAQAMSGSCNLDVICGTADGWDIVDGYRDIIRSVGVYGFNGNTFCTGFLVNNTAQDCRPLFMTANHCGVDNGNAPSMVVYWNYENSNCRQPNSPASGQNGNGTLSEFNTGAIFRASWAGADMALVELDDEIDPDVNPFFAGWDARGVAPGDSVICVHHPATEEKRISFEFDPTFIGDDNGNSNPSDNYVVVGDWDIGTTEGGSSGAPLFNQEKRVVGQLFGGLAACGNNSYDVYGWFHRSWTGGGAASNRLSNWLDPLGTGQLLLDGKDCGLGVATPLPRQQVCRPLAGEWDLTVLSTFTNNVTLSLDGLPGSANVVFSQNPVAPGGSSTLIILTNGLPDGTYPLVVRSSDGIDSSELFLELRVDGQAPAAVSLQSPTDGQTAVPTQPTFEWATTPSESYEVQLATDINFANLVEDGFSDGVWRPGTELTGESDYFWRVRGSNACGMGPWSAPATFRTGALFCQGEAATGLPLIIDNGPPNTINSTIAITETGQVGRVKIRNLQITHSWIDDLSLTLTSPSGTTITLMSGLDCSLEDADLNFDDTGQPYGDLLGMCNFSGPALAGTFQPQQSLATFQGESLQGVWTLAVIDGAGFDGGSLDNWELEICRMQAAALQVGTGGGEEEVCPGEDLLLPIQLGNDFGDGANVALSVSGLPTGVNASFAPNPGAGNATSLLTLTGWSGAGVHPLQIQAASSSLTRSHNLTVTAASLEAADLLSPADGSQGQPINPMLEWDPFLADSVEVQLATDAAFGNLVQATRLTGSSWTPAALDLNSSYFWRVISWNDCGRDTSATFAFSTGNSTHLVPRWTEDLRLYPNPAQEAVKLQLGRPAPANLHLTLYGPTGQVLQRQPWATGQQAVELALDGYPEGIYLLQLSGAGQQWTGKFFKVRE